MSSQPDQATFLHVVYFYPRPDAAADDAAKLVEGCKTHLPGIPGVMRLIVGTPAGSPRSVVDNAYAVALSVEFADSAAHDTYQDHPDHLRFVAECSRYWSGVKVYDSHIVG